VLRELIAWDTLHGEPGSFVDLAAARRSRSEALAGQLRHMDRNLCRGGTSADRHRRNGHPVDITISGG
jgi:hypothetical protein